MKILVVEDDEMLRSAITSVLTGEGYSVEDTGYGDEGLFLAEQVIYDLLVLDIMLHGMSGLEIVKQLREKTIHVPVLFLTAKDSIEDRVTGLNIGADDYLVKPFAVAELLARIKVLLRRKGSTSKELFAYKNISLNPKLQEAYYESQAIGLTVKEYDLLEYLVVNHERILTREQIFDRLWGYESDSSYGIVDVYVHHIRKKMAVTGCDHFIRTVRGVGYMLKENSQK
ncbi:response regulator transcription factor [Pelosinus baikalensis]|uniref:Response regulator transcription factor n=1 Tax=Pelosinus baikalensis TaxID=2892015 RepID=A0ABS8HVN0_9FIRM|nr:response regulator transcription factor [Pelosinus baikalensis]MCC5467221.1 response regulator transcription factor [Pelosinus baikalensis]